MSVTTNFNNQNLTGIGSIVGPLNLAGKIALGANPSSATETFTVSGNTSFVGNVTQVTDASSNLYVVAKRVPAGSAQVNNYVVGAVPLTTTTNLIQNYLSNAAAVVTNAPTYNPAVFYPTYTSPTWVNFGSGNSVALINPNTSNLFLEAWFYAPDITSPQSIFSISTPSGTEIMGVYVNTGVMNSFWYNQPRSGVVRTGTLAISTSTWTHVAFALNRVVSPQTIQLFVNGTASTVGQFLGSSPYYSAGDGSCFLVGGNLVAGGRPLNAGYIFDARALRGSIVPTTGFTGTVPASPAQFGLLAPGYVSNMNLGGSSNVIFSMQAEYFPGASTSPYGPCLTLPGTLGSYYQQSSAAIGANWKTYGFTIEAWVNYASLANSNVYYSSAPLPYFVAQTVGGNLDWGFGPTTTGALSFFTASSTPAGQYYSLTSPINSIVTGQWTHIAVQVSLTAISLYVNGVVQTLTAWNFTNTGSSTASSIPTTVPQLSVNGLTVGQWNATGGLNANFSVAKARLVYGSVTTTGNVYNMSGFTASPNLGPVPAGATVAWQLETQYPLPTYPSIQDVTELPQQASSYGSLPTPVGGVTSNTLSPYTGTQLQSLRFDGTGYIDYGNAATSVMTTNIWANAWTMEAWIYPTGSYASYPTIFGRNTPQGNPDFALVIDVNAILKFSYGSSGNGYYGYYPPYNTWTHIALVYDGTNVSTYAAGSRQGTPQAAVPSSMTFNPAASFQVGNDNYSHIYIGNLADVRVSNVARYTGSSYTVPSAPFTNDANTLLLLKSLAQQTGTTLEVQGRGTQSVSLGATRTVRTYPPAPITGWDFLDTTSNTAVTYGQGKYIASASTDWSVNNIIYSAGWAFNWGNGAWVTPSGYYSTSSPYGSISGTTTNDVLGNSYPGEWVQLQMPVSVILSNYQVNTQASSPPQRATKWWLLGSRDGLNWNLIDSQSGQSLPTATWVTYPVSLTQAYNYFRYVVNQVAGNSNGLLNGGVLMFNGTEEGICVTNDSKVGVGIANPQRSLEVAGDLVVGGTISGGNGMGSFRNRIINGDMRIAQRGTSNVVSTGVGAVAYLVDRFCTYTSFTGGNVTQYQTALGASDTPYQLGFRYFSNLTCLSAITGLSFFTYVQSIEGYNIADLNWGTSFGVPATVSFWFRTNAPTGSQFTLCINIYGLGTNYLVPYTVSSSGNWQYVTASIPPPPNGTVVNTTNSGGVAVYLTSVNSTTGTLGWNGTGVQCISGTYNWVAQAANYVHFTGVQLEKGTVATPFEFRPYATELQLCQRYTWKLNSSGSSGNTNFGIGIAQATNTMRFYLQTPVAMRDPYNLFVTTKSGSANLRLGSLSLTNGELSAYNGSSSIAITSIGNADWGYSNPTIIGFVLTASGTPFTVYQPWSIFTAAYTSDFILSCEL